MSAFGIVAEDDPRIQTTQGDVTAEGDVRPRMILAISRNNCARNRFVQHFRRDVQTLHATAKVELLAQIAAVAIMKLEIDVRVAAYAAEHWLLRKLDLPTQQ